MKFGWSGRNIPLQHFLKFLLRSESGNILSFFKIMFPEQENNIF